MIITTGLDAEKQLMILHEISNQFHIDDSAGITESDESYP